MTVPSDVSATPQPGPGEYVTGPAFALVLVKPGLRLMEVARVGYDAGELATWYQLELAAGRLAGYDHADTTLRNKQDRGSIWDIPPGTAVCPGMKLTKVSTP